MTTPVASVGGELEQVADEPAEPVGLGDDVGDERPAVVGDEPLTLHDVGVGPDERRRRPQLVRRIGDEPALGLERAADRDEGAPGDDERDDGRPDQADDPDEQDRRDDALRLLVVQGEHEPALDVPDALLAVIARSGAIGTVSSRTGDPARVDRPDVAPVRLRRLDGRRRRAGPARLTRDGFETTSPLGSRTSRNVSDAPRMASSLSSGLVARAGGRRGGPRRPTSTLAASARSTSVVEGPERDERGRRPDPDDQEGDQPERDDEQAPAGPRQQPGGRVGHPPVTSPARSV